MLHLICLHDPWSFDLSGNPPGGRETGRSLRDALCRDVSPWRHQRGARLHWADQRYLRPGAIRWHHNPGGLGGCEERLCAQRGSLLRRSDQEWPPLSLLIWDGTEGNEEEKKDSEGSGWRTKVLALWLELLVTFCCSFFRLVTEGDVGAILIKRLVEVMKNTLNVDE